MVRRVKKTQTEILSELLKNSKQSDRELARKVGVSQPTVSRIRSRLEKEGYIKEYTVIPNFSKLGYKIMAFTFARSQPLDKKAAEETRKIFKDSMKNTPFQFVMLERGIGLGFDAVILSLHRDYSSYLEVLKWLRQFAFLELDKIGSFLINLDDEVHYQPFTFSRLAEDFAKQTEKGE